MTRLVKVSGAGNDFLVLLEPERDPTPAQVLAWCARGFALGADGLFVLRRAAPGELAMTHWNADGGRVEQCLNGTRCAARLAFELGWAAREVGITTGAARIVGRRLERPGSAAIEVPAPEEPVRALAPEVDGLVHPGFFTRVGVPHFVLDAPGSLAAAPVARLGPALRRHAAFGPAGANVDWVRFPDRHRLEIRSFERGVEGETLACGSGVLAAVAVGLARGLCAPPVTALVLGGFELEVEVALDGAAIRGFTLAGDARIVGTIELAADGERVLPPAPAWSP